MKNFPVLINVSSIYGNSHEVEQAIMNMFNANLLTPATDGTVIDLRLNDIEVGDEDEDDNAGIMDEPQK